MAAGKSPEREKERRSASRAGRDGAAVAVPAWRRRERASKEKPERVRVRRMREYEVADGAAGELARNHRKKSSFFEGLSESDRRTRRRIESEKGGNGFSGRKRVPERDRVLVSEAATKTSDSEALPWPIITLLSNGRVKSLLNFPDTKSLMVIQFK